LQKLSSMISVLITRPRYDKATHYLYYWSEPLKKEAESKGYDVYDISKKKASRKNVISFLNKHNPTVVIFNGHGSRDSVCGHDNEELIKARQDSYLLKGKNIFIRACDCGKDLGPDAIQSGATGFVGYKEPFIFFWDKEKFYHPLDDKVAAPFLESSNQVAISLIKGHPADYAHKASIKVYRKRLEEMLTSVSNSDKAWALVWNMRNQVCYSEASKRESKKS